MCIIVILVSESQNFIEDLILLSFKADCEVGAPRSPYQPGDTNHISKAFFEHPKLVESLYNPYVTY